MCNHTHSLNTIILLSNGCSYMNPSDGLEMLFALFDIITTKLTKKKNNIITTVL